MKSSEQIDKLLAEQSAEWSERLRRGEERDSEEFAKWSLKSPQHMRHFLMMVALDRELQQLDPERHLEIPNVTATELSTVVPLHERTEVASSVIKHYPRRWMAAACAAGIALFAIGYFVATGTGWREYSTAQGEQRAVELADGSILQLNTQSQIKVRFTADGRDIRFLAGEALFKVAKDAARPFRVHTADIVIQAVGTQFNVYAQNDGTQVSVLEGRVILSTEQPISLGAGEEVKVDTKGGIARRQNANAAMVAVWRQRRLVFNQNPLSEVTAEFNRYNRTPQFRVMDDSVGQRPYSGAFDADDPESLVELLKVDPDLEVENNGAQILIRRRGSGL